MFCFVGLNNLISIFNEFTSVYITKLKLLVIDNKFLIQNAYFVTANLDFIIYQHVEKVMRLFIDLFLSLFVSIELVEIDG